MSTLVFPPADQPLDPVWWSPLTDVLASIGGVHRRHRLTVDDLLPRFRVERRERPDVYAYRHRWTRRHLYLDADGRAYRYVAPRHPVAGSGRYLPYRKLESALDGLALWDVPRGHLDFPGAGNHPAPEDAIPVAEVSVSTPGADAGHHRVHVV